MQPGSTLEISPSPPLREQPVCESAAEIIGHNEDLLTKILTHLSAKPLGKFRCVSKLWNSLISHLFPPPRALILHTHRKGCWDIEPEHAFLPLSTDFNNHLQGSEAPLIRSLTFVDEDEPLAVDIVGSSNGLLLCRKHPELYYGRLEFYYIYNPNTKQYRACPPIKQLKAVCLAYDPSASNYKVIGYRKLPERVDGIFQFEILIYSSETRLWRRVSDTRMHFRDRNLVCLRGKVHWMTTGGGFCFDLDAEQIKDFVVVTGESGRHTYFDTYFDEYRGRLFGVIGRYSRKVYEVYEMGAHYTEWSLKYTMDVTPLTYHTIFDIYVLSVVMEGNEDDSFASIYDHGIILRYHFKSKSFTELPDLSDFGERPDGALRVGPFKAHLYSGEALFGFDGYQG
ncbi:hypothetical protein Tsubulata_012638 [Turnera subulata]|uniref:F-box domain-containing protein n=1 Tax=Turnera subulata TaxID=218843 RepID=A0A9Q0JA62_9ROSI|nr:hypothetical protein Tsubulata_012638 [Turnera subulata]